MPLKMRPPRLGHCVYKNTVDYSVFCGEWCVGRIYIRRAPARPICTGLGVAPPRRLAASVRSPGGLPRSNPSS
jgi:hypothetical protein